MSLVLRDPAGTSRVLSSLGAELSGKRLELLKEIVPKLSRVAVFGTSSEPGNARGLKDTELAARVLGVKLQYVDILTWKDIEPGFRAAVMGKPTARSFRLEGQSSILTEHRLENLR
jgi:putative tryptophan/tyrosine transport system substrate-binding protein